MNQITEHPFRQLPLAALEQSRTNPRVRFDPAALAELVESIRAHDVIEPIIVRRLAASKSEGEKFEIVAGARRFRAATMAGRESMPAIVRELTDAQVLEIQVIENVQREALHPLEEAAGYRALMDDHAYTAEALAEKVGKSREYIFARLKLLDLLNALSYLVHISLSKLCLMVQIAGKPRVFFTKLS